MEEIFNCDVICATISRILSQKHGCKVEFTMTKPTAEQRVSDEQLKEFLESTKG